MLIRVYSWNGGISQDMCLRLPAIDLFSPRTITQSNKWVAQPTIRVLKKQLQPVRLVLLQIRLKLENRAYLSINIEISMNEAAAREYSTQLRRWSFLNTGTFQAVVMLSEQSRVIEH